MLSWLGHRTNLLHHIGFLCTGARTVRGGDSFCLSRRSYHGEESLFPNDEKIKKKAFTRFGLKSPLVISTGHLYLPKFSWKLCFLMAKQKTLVVMSFSGVWGILMLKFQMSTRYLKCLSLSISHEKWRLRQKNKTIFLSEKIFWVKIDKLAKTRGCLKNWERLPNGTAKKLWHFNCIWQHTWWFFPYKNYETKSPFFDFCSVLLEKHKK